MDRTPPPLIVIAIWLAALAGFVDAIAFTSLGGFFASFMSGNSTRLGVGLGGAGPSEAAMAGALILSFVSGVIVAGVVARARGARHREAIMAVVTALLAAAATMASLQPGPIALLFLAAAMGCQKGMFGKDGDTIGMISITGSLVGLGQKLSNALMGDADRWGWVPYLLLWTGFVAGVVGGAVLHWRLGIGAWWLAALASASVALWFASAGRHRAVERDPGG